MQTAVYTSKKLEKIISKFIKTQKVETHEGILGKWNATLFYIARKKCLLFTNTKTAYNIILTDVKLADWNLIDDLFKDALYAQLIYDGIMITYSYLDSIIVTLNFHPTDNDKRIIGFQNNSLKEIEYWEHQFGTIDKIHIKDLTHRLNIIPIHLGKGRKISDFTTSKKEMQKLLYN